MSDYSVYPDAIDGYAQLPLVVDRVTRIDAITVNRLRDAIIKIESELGVDPSAEFDTVRARLDALEQDINNSVPFIFGYKNPARLASTGNISNLSSGAPLIVDGETVAVDDRILVHQQTDMSENGIYTVVSTGSGSNGVWERTADANSINNLLPGSEIFVVEGAVYSSSKFWLITPGPYVLETTPLEFTKGLQVMQSDAAPTTILNATALGLGSSNAVETNSIAVRNFKEIDFSFTATNLGSITEIRARVLYSVLASPDPYSSAPEDWILLLAEDIAGGVATVDPYTISLDVAQYPAFDTLPGTFGFRIPISGLHMMVQLWSQSGSPVGSSFVGSALRRI